MHGVALLAFVAALGESSAASAPPGAPGCTVLGVVGPSFGHYDRFATLPNDSAGYLSVQCDDVGATGVIVVELGRGRRGTVDRQLRSGGNRLDYNLYVDAARTRIWGDGKRGTSVQQLRPVPGVQVTLPIYGRIPPLQSVPPGHYTDRVQLVMQY